MLACGWCICVSISPFHTLSDHYLFFSFHIFTGPKSLACLPYLIHSSLFLLLRPLALSLTHMRSLSSLFAFFHSSYVFFFGAGLISEWWKITVEFGSYPASGIQCQTHVIIGGCTSMSYLIYGQTSWWQACEGQNKTFRSHRSDKDWVLGLTSGYWQPMGVFIGKASPMVHLGLLLERAWHFLNHVVRYVKGKELILSLFIRINVKRKINCIAFYFFPNFFFRKKNIYVCSYRNSLIFRKYNN